MSDETQNFIFPVTPSPFDGRDYVWEHHVPPQQPARRSLLTRNRSVVPETLDLSLLLPTPRNQGARGTCAAFAVSAIKEYQERIDTNYRDYMSPESVYFYRSNKPSSGMFLRDVMKILTEKGISRESFFPYGSTEPETVPEKALTDMPNWKIAKYAAVTTMEGLKEALYKQGPCIIAFPVYDGSPEFWRAKQSDSKMIGGHAVAVIGYNKEGFILRNSWGANWNGKGTVLYPYTEWGKHWEIWTCLDLDSDHRFPDPPPSNNCLNIFKNIHFRA